MGSYANWARFFSGSLLLGAAGFAIERVHRVLPTEGVAPSGLTIDTERADGHTPVTVLLETAATKRLQRHVNIVHEGTYVVTATLAELGARVETRPLEPELSQVGHTGTVWHRLAEAFRARAGETHAVLVTTLPTEELATRLATIKETLDTKPTEARWDFATGRALAHHDGQLVDVEGTVDAVLAATREVTEEPATVPLVFYRLAPSVTAEVLPGFDQSAELGRYETLFAFAGGQEGRARNVARAAEAIDGVVWLAGELLSFNEHVGARSVENGFSKAGELYKGESRMGIGGGTCQVASTLHAAAVFGGFEVVARSPHSRPSGYIPIGLDATVVYPDVDLQLRNPFEFPVIVQATSHAGKLTLRLLGRQKMANVELKTSTIGEKPFGRRVDKFRYFTKGRSLRKQAGRKGVVLEKVRTLHFLDGRMVTETTRDTYPPTIEIYVLGPGANEADLPPLEAAVKAQPEGELDTTASVTPEP